MRIVCTTCGGDPFDQVSGNVCPTCEGECVIEVSAKVANSLARCYGKIYDVDSGEYMNASAKAVIQTLSDDQLKGCDFQILIDHSSSMGEASLRRQGATRFQELEEDTTGLARDAQKYDDDGLTVIAFSSAVRVFDGVKSDAVSKVFMETNPRGSTNLADALQAAVTKAEGSQKNNVILCFTDGVPDDEQAVYRVINAAGNKLGRPRIGITFVQVGEDSRASAFLQKLNSQLAVDIVAVASAKEAEGLTLGQLAWMAQNS